MGNTFCMGIAPGHRLQGPGLSSASGRCLQDLVSLSRVSTRLQQELSPASRGVSSRRCFGMAWRCLCWDSLGLEMTALSVCAKWGLQPWSGAGTCADKIDVPVDFCWCRTALVRSWRRLDQSYPECCPAAVPALPPYAQPRAVVCRSSSKMSFICPWHPGGICNLLVLSGQ